MAFTFVHYTSCNVYTSLIAEYLIYRFGLFIVDENIWYALFARPHKKGKYITEHINVNIMDLKRFDWQGRRTTLIYNGILGNINFKMDLSYVETNENCTCDNFIYTHIKNFSPYCRFSIIIDDKEKRIYLKGYYDKFYLYKSFIYRFLNECYRNLDDYDFFVKMGGVYFQKCFKLYRKNTKPYM